MGQTDVLESETENSTALDLKTLNINYDKLQCRGGAVLVTPVD